MKSRRWSENSCKGLINVLDLQQCVTMACLLDVIAPKPGNVHRGADFEDATFLDFAASAVAIGPIIAQAPNQGLGPTILGAVQATRQVTATNTNLGIILLLAPLASVADQPDPAGAIGKVLRQTSEQDALDLFRAIRLAGAGGLGQVAEMDATQDESQPTDILSAMELARERDTIAELYVTDFRALFQTILPQLVSHCHEYGPIHGLIASHVALLASQPDTLIARKCGKQVAAEASQRAAQITGQVGSEEWWRALSDLDFWLRADGNRRNPGTTADLLTAAMFQALYDRRVKIGTYSGIGEGID